MFDQLFQNLRMIARHRKGYYLEQRQRYLAACHQQGEPTT